MEIKLSNAGRVKKREKMINYPGFVTPPKYTNRNSTLITVDRWEKKFGYHYQGQDYEVCKLLIKKRDEFRKKAT